jgi:hypothetical protein
MQTKDIIKQPLTQEWAVVGLGHKMRNDDKTNLNIFTRRLVSKVTLVSYDTYAETHSWEQTKDAPIFVKTDLDKTKRFLVREVRNDGTEAYFVRPASEFLADWATVDTKLTAQEAEEDAKSKAQQAEQEERQRRYEIERQARETNEANLESAKEASIQTIRSVLGFTGVALTKVELYSTGTWSADGSVYTPKIGGDVTIDYNEFQRLIEKVMESVDA